MTETQDAKLQFKIALIQAQRPQTMSAFNSAVLALIETLATKEQIMLLQKVFYAHSNYALQTFNLFQESRMGFEALSEAFRPFVTPDPNDPRSEGCAP